MILIKYFAAKHFDTNRYIPIKDIETAAIVKRSNAYKLFFVCAVLSNEFKEDIVYGNKKDIDAIFAISKDIASGKDISEILNAEQFQKYHELYKLFLNCCGTAIMEIPLVFRPRYPLLRPVLVRIEIYWHKLTRFAIDVYRFIKPSNKKR